MDTKFYIPAMSDLKYEVYDIRNTPFKIYGLYKSEELGLFKRMPQDVADKVSPNVSKLNLNPAGGRLRFQTDSRFIAIKVKYEKLPSATPRAAALNITGAFFFDLYADGEYRGSFLPMSGNVNTDTVIPSFPVDEVFESYINLKSNSMRDIVICFPSFAYISQVYIALEEKAELKAGNTYVNEKPVVFYGSSITQGACASRPGNIYQNLLSQKWNMDYVNLGFSGSALAEDSIIDYISQMDMQMLVFDYDHNAPTSEYLEKTHYKALEKIRSVQKDIPIFILTRPNISGGVEEVEKRRNIIYTSYQTLCNNGDQNVYFVDGGKAFHSLNKNMMTIDGIHPNDFGFYCIAREIERVMANNK